MRQSPPFVAALLFGCLALAAVHRPAWAFEPPVDKAGPLTVRIEGPTQVTQTGVALPLRVVIENAAEETIRGTVRLGLIDRWTARPAEPVPFQAAGKATTALVFQVTAAPGTYNALYPIHAYAEFQADGRSLAAHPILILETKLAHPPRASVTVPWRPVALAENGELALWRMPVQRSVVAVFGRQPKLMPVGWQGSEVTSRGATYLRRQTLDGQSRQVVAIHPPWWQGNVGTQWIEYPIALPGSGPITLHFANAVTPTGKGDGVTFRVHVLPLDAPAGKLGEVVYEHHTAAKTWSPAEADLSRFAGQTIRLQLESHPGPKNNTGWDQSYWAEPLLVAGNPPPAAPLPPAGTTGSRLLGKIACGGQEYEVRLWPGRRGLLDAVVGFSHGEHRLYFRGFQVRVLGGRIDDAASPISLEKTIEEPCQAGVRVRHRFAGYLGTFDVVVHLRVEQGVLKAGFSLENAPPPQPWQVVYLEDIAAGPWSDRLEQVYAGTGNVLRRPGEYRLGFDGHRLSTSFVGFDFAGGVSLVQASDVPPVALEIRPREAHASLHAEHQATLTFIPSGNVFEALKLWRTVNGLKPAGGVHKAAGRFVFDLWGGRYGASATALRRAFRYGLTDAMVVWHNWQRWGYDYRLPNLVPPNPRWGTLEEMRDLMAACREAGVPFALHDNYIDFYPDADGFSYPRQIAFHHDGTPVKAWLNKGRDAQSYRYRADAIAPLLNRNVQWLRQNMPPTAYFIDVWSSARPYDYWTADGRFFTAVQTRDTWGKLFASIRDTLGGDAPQISESGHDQLIGWLDGAQTNHLRVGKSLPGNYGWCVWDWPCDDAERTPWFDAAHHDRFVLHGAGYSVRYAGGLDPRLHGIYSDDYLATEVLTGHPAMVSQPFGRDVVRTYWLLGEWMRALALRTIERVEYVGGDLHRQHVTWSGGAEVWVNRGETDWDLDGRTLPQYGFLARVPGDRGTGEAALERRGGVVVEWAASPAHVYVHGRKLVAVKLPKADPLVARWNAEAKPIDFGAVVTADGCRLSRQDQGLLVVPLPADRARVAFAATIRWPKLPWSLPRPTLLEAIDEQGNVLSRQPIDPAAGQIEITGEGKAFGYRLRTR